MCSVIEIKNADEYHIQYYSPESMEVKEDKDKQNSEQHIKSCGSSDDGNNTSCTSGHQSERRSNSKSPAVTEELKEVLLLKNMDT